MNATTSLVLVLFALPAAGFTAEHSLRESLDQLQHPPDVATRWRAVESLAHYQDLAVPPLRRLLADEDQHVRLYACSALIRLGPHAQDATADLVAIVSDPGEDENLRECAIVALGQIGPTAASAVPALQALLQDAACPHLWSKTVRALASIASPEAVAVLTERFERGEPRHREEILSALKSRDGAIRSALPSLLSVAARRPHDVLGDKIFLTAAEIGREAVDDLTPYLQSPFPETRRRAAMVLNRLGPEAADAVMHLSKALRDETAYVRFWAVKALGSIGPNASQAVPLLLPMLDDTDPNVRWGTVSAIGKIAPAAIVEDSWNRLLNDPDPGVRQRAAAIRFTIR
jgi:HEAT repeat protein